MPKAAPGAQMRLPFNLALLKIFGRLRDTELQFGTVKSGDGEMDSGDAYPT